MKMFKCRGCGQLIARGPLALAAAVHGCPRCRRLLDNEEYLAKVGEVAESESQRKIAGEMLAGNFKADPIDIGVESCLTPFDHEVADYALGNGLDSELVYRLVDRQLRGKCRAFCTEAELLVALERVKADMAPCRDSMHAEGL